MNYFLESDDLSLLHPILFFDTFIYPSIYAEVYHVVSSLLNHTHIYIYTGCNRRNVRDFGRVFLRSNCTDITQNTYIQSSMVTEILAREKCGLRVCVLCTLSMTSYSSVSAWPQRDGPSCIAMLSLDAVQWPWYGAYVLVYSGWKSVDNYDTSASVFVFQFNL